MPGKMAVGEEGRGKKVSSFRPPSQSRDADELSFHPSSYDSASMFNACQLHSPFRCKDLNTPCILLAHIWLDDISLRSRRYQLLAEDRGQPSSQSSLARLE